MPKRKTTPKPQAAAPEVATTGPSSAASTPSEIANPPRSEGVLPVVEIPDWINETPQFSYCLTMFDEDGESIQDIDLSRDEFIELKKYLARTRYPVSCR